MQQRLRRYAAYVEAHPSQRIPALDEDDVQAEVSSAEGGRVTTRPCADDDQLRLVRRILRRTADGRPDLLVRSAGGGPLRVSAGTSPVIFSASTAILTAAGGESVGVQLSFRPLAVDQFVPSVRKYALDC